MRNRYEFHASPQVNEEEEDDAQEIKYRNSIYSVSVFYALAIIVFMLGIYGTAYALYEILPTPVKISEEVSFIQNY